MNYKIMRLKGAEKMVLELNKILDIIESDLEYWCDKKMEYNCNPNCKYYKCICSTAADDIENVRKLAATCFGSSYEKND